MSWKEKNCYNNAWVYNVYMYMSYVYGYINLRIESQHPLVMVQIIFYLATVYFSYISYLEAIHL